MSLEARVIAQGLLLEAILEHQMKVDPTLKMRFDQKVENKLVTLRKTDKDLAEALVNVHLFQMKFPPLSRD